MNTYNIFLDYYDRIVRQINSPLEDEVDFLEKDCIKKYHPKVKTILETACWTWVVALELQKKWFLVTWLDFCLKNIVLLNNTQNLTTFTCR